VVVEMVVLLQVKEDSQEQQIQVVAAVVELTIVVPQVQAQVEPVVQVLQ
jgi:hypothetical protein